MMGAGGVTGLVHELVRRTLTLACAESLTGGALSSAIVSVPGASETFRGASLVTRLMSKQAFLEYLGRRWRKRDR